MADRPTKAPSDQHLGETQNIVKAMAWLLVPLTAGAIVFWGLGLPGAPILFTATVAAWAVFGIYLLIDRLVIRPAGTFAGHLLMPSGASTPGAKPISHIQAMEARGDLAKAAEAYRAEIAADPKDVVSCEQLGQLALRRLRDYDLAAWAYREAERRADAPARKFGYGLLAASICRDQLKDLPRTVAELKRLVQQYPNAPRVDALKAEIDELRIRIIEEKHA